MSSIAALVLAATLAQAKAEPQPVEVKHRITGLFAPDRVDDLRASFRKIADVTLVSVDFDRAEAVLSYLPQKLSNKKQEQEREKEILERLDNLLRQASSHTFGVKALSTTPADKLTRIEIPVLGLDCRACCLAAYEVIAKIDGVEAATCSFKESRMSALIDPGKTGRAALEEALKKRGVTLKSP